jgi:hypothetical protein
MINIQQTAANGEGFVNEDGKFVHNFTFTENASTATNIKAYGITSLTSTAAKSFTLDAPYKGAYKEIVMTAGTTTINTVVAGSTVNGISIGGSATTRKLEFNGINDAVTLRGISDTKWL